MESQAFPYRRPIVIDASRSGKTGLVEQPSQRLKMDFIELDALYWLPGITASRAISPGRAQRPSSGWMIFWQLWRRTWHRWRAGKLSWGRLFVIAEPFTP
jgi:hypothetical protein